MVLTEIAHQFLFSTVGKEGCSSKEIIVLSREFSIEQRQEQNIPISSLYIGVALSLVAKVADVEDVARVARPSRLDDCRK